MADENQTNPSETVDYQQALIDHQAIMQRQIVTLQREMLLLALVSGMLAAGILLMRLEIRSFQMQ